jgi:hypothetical protein
MSAHQQEEGTGANQEDSQSEINVIPRRPTAPAGTAPETTPATETADRTPYNQAHLKTPGTNNYGLEGVPDDNEAPSNKLLTNNDPRLQSWKRRDGTTGVVLEAAASGSKNHDNVDHADSDHNPDECLQEKAALTIGSNMTGGTKGAVDYSNLVFLRDFRSGDSQMQVDKVDKQLMDKYPFFVFGNHRGGKDRAKENSVKPDNANFDKQNTVRLLLVLIALG